MILNTLLSLTRRKLWYCIRPAPRMPGRRRAAVPADPPNILGNPQVQCQGIKSLPLGRVPLRDAAVFSSDEV
ncbi:unnamed protein product, partial [Amoebophrya sp. A25]|eukprot:GSA25T00008862001.1